jgi:hypothetical protein
LFQIEFLGADGRLFSGFYVDWHGLIWVDDVATDVIKAGAATVYVVTRLSIACKSEVEE